MMYIALLFKGGYYMLNLVQLAAAIREQLQFEVQREFKKILYMYLSITISVFLNTYMTSLHYISI